MGWGGGFSANTFLGGGGGGGGAFSPKPSWGRANTLVKKKKDGGENMTDFSMIFLAVVTWFLKFSQIVLLNINRIQEDALMPNLLQIGRETAERWREKKQK